MEASHLDNDPTNNHLSNLVWETHKENMQRSTKMSHAHTEATKHKMSISHKGKILPDKVKRKVSESKRGHSVSVETREKIRKTLTGSRHSDETRKKMSASNKKRWKERKAV